MPRPLAALAALRHDRRAVTALEYGLVSALIAGVIIAAVSVIGVDLRTIFTTINAAFPAP